MPSATPSASVLNAAEDPVKKTLNDAVPMIKAELLANQGINHLLNDLTERALLVIKKDKSLQDQAESIATHAIAFFQSQNDLGVRIRMTRRSIANWKSDFQMKNLFLKDPSPTIISFLRNSLLESILETLIKDSSFEVTKLNKAFSEKISSILGETENVELRTLLEGNLKREFYWFPIDNFCNANIASGADLGVEVSDIFQRVMVEDTYTIKLAGDSVRSDDGRSELQRALLQLCQIMILSRVTHRDHPDFKKAAFKRFNLQNHLSKTLKVSSEEPWQFILIILELYELIHELVERTEHYRGKFEALEGKEIRRRFCELAKKLKRYKKSLPYCLARCSWNAMQFAAILKDHDFFRESYNQFIDLYSEKQEFFDKLLHKDPDTGPMMADICL